ncbi:MAG: PDZ domain-containing protein [Intrasporangium sp.]|uniref:YlbL family protein n=1 Tax=Intrasporangium sp. TaxID=1925024 RepID=UPI002649CD09|nr:S16 family serine protease [Intrasporangium sp.]MDN5796728.1 PDZ domain-containing protein [Intrasporangium sp.]
MTAPAGPAGDGGPGADESAPGDPAAGDAPAARLGRRHVAVLVVFFLALSAVVVGSVVPLPYAILSPGPTFNALGEERLNGTTKPVIVVQGRRTYPTEGSLRFLTILVKGGPGYRVDAWDLLGAWVDPARDIYPVDQIIDPDASKQEVAEELTIQMQGSQQEAKAVALRAVGETVPTYVVVAQVLDSSKAKDLLKPGDRFVSVDGVAASDPKTIRDALQGVEPGDPVAIEIIRAGAHRTVEVPTISGSGGRTAIGVLLGVEHDFPVTVTINAGDVGGPSAGLMFALAIYDKLTPGSLTGDHAVAGTGTIDEQAQVGPIGGIHQKLIAAKDAGATYFLAPAANCPGVVGHVPDGLQVVKVSTFDEAVSAVEAIARGAAGGLPHC